MTLRTPVLTPALFLLDLLVAVLPSALFIFTILYAGLAAAGLPVPGAIFSGLMFLALANILQFGSMAIHLYRDYLRRHNASSRFWGGVLIHYFSLGATLYYLAHVRGTLSLDHGAESYRTWFRSKFLTSPITRIVRLINKMWGWLFIALLLVTLLVAFPMRSDMLFLVSMRMAAGTLAIGGMVSSYFLVLLLRDAAIRSEGSEAERRVAREIYSSFSAIAAAERYYRAVSAVELSAKK